MPIDEHISGPSSATTVEVPVNTPAAPTWLGNAEREIDVLLDTADNGYQTSYVIEVEENGVAGAYVFRGEVYADTDVLVLTSDQCIGSPQSIDIADGKYDPTEAAEALQTAMNASNTLTGTGTITFVVTNVAGKFTIDAGAGHTIAYTHSGSDAAALYGFTGNIAAAQTITSQDYGLFNATTATPSLQTIADWTTVIRVMNLSSPTSPLPYRFRTIAYSANTTYSATSEWSEIMMPHIDLAISPASNSLTYECTTGDCKVSGLSVTALGDAYPGMYTIAYTLTRLHNVSTKNNVKIYYSVNNGSSYTELTSAVTAYGDNTSQFDITISSGYTATYTYDGTGTAPLFVSNGLAAGQMITINSSTFNAANNGSFRVLAVAETYFTVENASGVAETNKVLSAATSLTSCVSIGGAISTLTASAAGTANSNKWASCAVLGNSYYNTGVYIKVVPYDEATGGAAGDEATATVSIDNRPKSVTIAEISDFSWDKDTTPEIVAPMGSLVCGTALYFILSVTNNTTGVETLYSSAERPAGWYYEQVIGAGSATRNPETGWDTGWNACTYAGVPWNYLYPAMATGNRVRYIFQNALTQGVTYTVVLRQAEYVSELV